MKLLTFLLLLCCLTASAQTELDVDNNANFAGFEYLDEAPDSARVFLAGENHAFRPFNNLIKEKSLRYLHAHRDVRLWISEMGAGRAYLINQALVKGDTSIFKTMIPISWEEDIDQYRRMVAFNDSLPEADRISIHGVDVEHGWLSIVLALDHILDRPSHEAHDSIRLDLEALHGLAREIKTAHGDGAITYGTWNGRSPWLSNDVAIANLRAFRNNIQRNRSKMNAFLGDNRADFDRVFTCLDRTLRYEDLEYQGLVYANVFRELHLAEEVASLVHSHPGKNAYGQFGRCHVSQADTDSSCTRGVISSLAGRLQNEAEYHLAGQVVSTAYLYPQYDWSRVENPVYNHVRDLQEAFGLKKTVVVRKKEVPDSLLAQVESVYDHYVVYPEGTGTSDMYGYESYEREAGDRGMGMMVLGYQYADLNDVQSGMSAYLGDLGLEWSTLQRQYVSIGMGGYGTLDGYNMIMVDIGLGGGNQIENDTLEVGWNSLLVSWEFGWDLAWTSDHLNVTPKGVLSYYTNSFTFEQRVPVNTLTDPVSRTTTRYDLYNHALLLGGGLNVEWEGDHLVMGLRTTYFRDVSRPEWKTWDVGGSQSDSINLEDAPKTRFHHFAAGLYVGFPF